MNSNNKLALPKEFDGDVARLLGAASLIKGSNVEDSKEALDIYLNYSKRAEQGLHDLLKQRKEVLG